MLHPHPGDGRVSSSLQLRRPVTNFWPPVAGSLYRVGQVLSCLSAPDGHLGVGLGDQNQDCDIYQFNLHGVNRACVLKIIVNAFLRGIKFVIVLLPFCYIAQDEGGSILQTDNIVFIFVIQMLASGKIFNPIFIQNEMNR